VKNRSIKHGDLKIEENYFSRYDNDVPMTKQEIVVAMELILETLNMNENTADFVCEILADDKWSMRKLRDAIKYVIKTHRYKEIKPADILSYDKEIKFYNYLGMLELGGQGFKCVKIPDIPNTMTVTDPRYGEKGIEVGWYVKANEVIPESWEILSCV
jgi:hypothetical protein